MLGMTPGNGHPYSWSAIINSYDKAAMAGCPYAAIPAYLNAQPFEAVRVPGARVTHIWTDDPADAPLVSRASLIAEVVGRPEDVIGRVDAVFVASGDGFDHVLRARPFVEAGLPVFVDKPLALTVADLQTFVDWKRKGARILSSSGMRYAPALDPLLADRSRLGELRWISSLMCKDWEGYGIHAFEPVFRLLGPGFTSVRLESQPRFETAHILHRTGVQVTVPVIYDGTATFGTVHLAGTAGQATLQLSDTYTAFRRQLVSFIDYVRTGGPDPYPFAETVEMMAVIAAGIRSRTEGSRRVDVAEVLGQLRP
jgi:predicted dehydrogenase